MQGRGKTKANAQNPTIYPKLTIRLFVIQKEGVEHSTVASCRRAGMPAQVAFNHVGGMLRACVRDWYMALAELPSWGKKVDREVQRYVQGVKNVVMANLNWRFVIF